MCQVDRIRSQHTFEWNRCAGICLSRLKIPDTPVNCFDFTGRTVENGVEDLHQKSIFIVMIDDGIVAMQKILACGLYCRFQSGNDLRILRLAVCDDFVLEGH